MFFLYFFVFQLILVLFQIMNIFFYGFSFSKLYSPSPVHMQILYKDVRSSLMLSESSSSSLPVGVPARLGTSSSTPVNQLTPCNPHPICPVPPPLWFWWWAGGGSPLCAVAKGARAGWPSYALVKRPACQSVWGKSGWLVRPSVYTHSYIYSLCVCVFKTLGMAASTLYSSAPPPLVAVTLVNSPPPS